MAKDPVEVNLKNEIKMNFKNSLTYLSAFLTVRK